MSKDNSIIVVGVIKEMPVYSHNSNNEKFFKGIIETERKSGVNDKLSIIMSECLVDEEFIDKKIKVYGEIRTHNIDGKLLLSIFVQEIEFVDDEDIDEVKLNGYICKKFDIRTTPVTNRKIISFVLAINRIYGKTDYIPCVCWGGDAKKISKIEVGSNVKLEGRLQSRVYIKNDAEYTTYEMSAYKVS